MIYRISGKVIPEHHTECQDTECEKCEMYPLAPKYSYGKYMFVLIPECPYRKALAGNARFERLTARPKLLKFVRHLIDETIQKEIYDEIVEQTKAIITEQGEHFKILGVLRGRVISIDSGREEFWWIPQIYKTRRSFRVGWLWWALYTLRFTEDKDE